MIRVAHTIASTRLIALIFLCVEIVLSMVFFTAAICYARFTRALLR